MEDAGYNITDSPRIIPRHLWCKCVKQPAEGIFETEKMYLAKMITASNPQEYHGELVDEGFFVLDGDDVILHFSMTDFPAFFKVE